MAPFAAKRRAAPVRRKRFWRSGLPLFVLLVSSVALADYAAAQPQNDATRSAAIEQLSRGAALFRAGDMTAAATAWSEAIRLSRQASAPDIEAQALARRGEMYRTQGYLRNASDDLQTALATSEALGNAGLIAATSGALGNLELAARHDAAAEKLLQRARDLAQQTGARTTLAASENDLGNLYAQTARPDQAASAYIAASASAEAAGDANLAASAEVNAARLAIARHDPVKAAALLNRAAARLEKLPPSYSHTMTLLSAGNAALDVSPASPEYHRLAERAFRAAAAMAETLHNPSLVALASGGLGRLYAQTGRRDDAAQANAQAVFAAQATPASPTGFRWEWQQARLARDRGQTDAALASYRRAVAGLQSVRQDIPVAYQAGQSSYRTTFGPLYLEYADLLLRQSATRRDQAAVLMREARDTIEQLKESELQDYFRDACVTSFEAREQSIETVAPGTAVIYPITLPDRLELLVSIGREQQQFTIPLREAELRSEVRQFRELLEKRTTNEYLTPARQLYDQVIRPIEPLLAQRHVNTLVIVPDSVLRIIPFAALHDGHHFLAERYATAVAPSLHLIDPKPLAAGPRLALVLGISQSVQGFVDLPNVTNEVAAVHAMEGGRELVNSAFTQTSFGGELKSVPYNIVHVASHGQFGSDPKQSFLLAYDGKLSLDTLETDIKYGQRRENALELLVLSACETASGDDRAALGLAGIALKAGARSALASLWYVSDQAAGELVVDFYRALGAGEQSKAHALQTAQRQMIASRRYAHPAYWAPFLLIGNWL